MISVYSSSDYAGLSTDKISFYYGYEVTKCLECKELNDTCKCEDSEGEWCFEATVAGKKALTIPCSELEVDMFDVAKALLKGIGHFIQNQGLDTFK